jgi:hypothetical protein
LLKSWGNDASRISLIRINKSTKALMGIAAAQGRLPGGGIQLFIADRSIMEEIITFII